MAISVDGFSYTGSTAITLNANIPVGTTQGDLLLAWWVVRIANRPTGQMVIPAGWTELGYQAASGSSPTTKVVAKVWNTGDSTQYSFINTGSANHGVSILRISGINTGTFTTGGRIQFGAHRDGTRFSGTVNSIVVSTPNSMLLHGAGANTNGSIYLAPASMNEELDSTSLNNTFVTSQSMNSQIISASGSTGDKTTYYSGSAQFVGFLWWVEPAPAGGGPQTVNLSSLGITGSAINLSVVPGAMSVGLSSLHLTGSAISLSVVPGAVSVPVSTLNLTGSAVSLSVIPGAISVGLSSLHLTGSAIGLSVVPGTVTVSLSSLNLTGSAISLTPIGGAVSVGLSSLHLTGSAIGLSTVPGAVSVPLSTIGLTGSAISLSVIPGATSVFLSTLGLTGSAISLAVTQFANVTVTLSTLNITGSVNNISVVPGAATIPLSSLGLTGSAVSMSVLPGAVTTLLNTLGLTATVNDLSVFVAIAGIVPTKRIYHVGYENRVITIEIQEEHHVGYGNRTTNIDEVE